MLRSMLSAVSGLRSHQTMMDVVGHNIANVNTPGFKSSRITFEEALAQVLGGARAGTGHGGVNPLQVGLGSRVSSIDGVFTQGASHLTGRITDLAIQGDGFFVLNLGGEQIYTRAGAFSFDESGNLVAANGALVMGWLAQNGAVDTQLPLASITLPLSEVIGGEATTLSEIGGNLNADLAIGEDQTISFGAYDSLGTQHDVVLTLTKAAANTWDVAVTVDGAAAGTSLAQITFDTQGNLSSSGTISVTGPTPAGAEQMLFDIELGGTAGLVQYAGASSAEAHTVDGKALGYLRGFEINEDGSLVAQFSNGEVELMGQIATATFENPGGLVRVGDSHFAQSLSSGGPNVGAPGEADRGLLSPGTLEMSNVDLALEFTNLIMAQRGFQANGRVITASDEMLADLVNLMR